MITKKTRVVIAVVSLLLCSSILMIVPIGSQGIGEYNPWADINDDGIVDLYDAILLANAFNQAGDPGNKTELLYNASKTFADLLSTIAALNSTLQLTTSQIGDLQAQIATMNTSILQLKSELADMNATIATKLGAPDYDSGWFQLNKSQSIILVHNLNTTDVMCYMMGNDTDGNFYTHQIAYGGDNYVGGAMGVYWDELTSATVKVTRANGDNYWDYVRFFIWKVYK